jgi:hypothetical protein
VPLATWTHWSRQTEAFPGEPIVVRRRVLTVVTVGFMALWAVWIFATLPVPKSEDGLTSDGSWQILALGLIFGVLYLYSSSVLIIREHELVARNPLWTVRIPNESLTAAAASWHLVLVAGSHRYVSWAVEARNIELATDDVASQDSLLGFIEQNCVRGDEAGLRPEVRPRIPGPMFWIGIAPSVYAVIVLSGRA